MNKNNMNWWETNMERNKLRRKNQYELTTTNNLLDMPEPIFANNKTEALLFVNKRLRKKEKVVKLERIYR